MSTQSSGHPPTQFSISTPLRHVRLLEIPDDLLSTLTDQSTEHLIFKSASVQSRSLPGSSSHTLQGQREGVLHLCTREKAWAVKQVSTSNSVYLIQPCRPDPSATILDNKNDDTEMQDIDQTALEVTSRRGVTAIAQVGNFLELHPVKIDEVAIESAIINSLSTYHPQASNEDIDLDLQSANESKPHLSIAQLTQEIAAPDNIITKCCSKLCVFETTNPTTGTKRCMIPTTRTVLDTWSKIIESCAIEDIKLDSSDDSDMNTNLIKVLNALSNDDEDDNTDVAIAEQLLKSNGTFDSFDLFGTINDDSANRAGERKERKRRLKANETTRFIAGLILSAQPSRQMPAAEFTSKWTDLVPSSFVKSCTLESLITTTTSSSSSSSTTVVATTQNSNPFEIIKSENTEETATIIKWNGTTQPRDIVLVSALSPDAPVAIASTGAGAGTTDAAAGIGATGSTGSSVKPAAGGSTTDKKRKWHEKFGAQRNKRQ